MSRVRAPSQAQDASTLTVETAAVRIGAAVFTLPRPNRHHNILWWLSTLGVRSVQLHDQGFVLSNGEYASRKLAAKIALRNGQVKELYAPPHLFSEDLWDGGADLPRPDVLAALAAGEPSPSYRNDGSAHPTNGAQDE